MPHPRLNLKRTSTWFLDALPWSELIAEAQPRTAMLKLPEHTQVAQGYLSRAVPEIGTGQRRLTAAEEAGRPSQQADLNFTHN